MSFIRAVGRRECVVEWEASEVEGGRGRAIMSVRCRRGLAKRAGASWWDEECIFFYSKKRVLRLRETVK